MKNEKLFNETIDKLVKAYFEGELEHKNCGACAVGNITGTSEWKDFFFTAENFKEDQKRDYKPIRTYMSFTQVEPTYTDKSYVIDSPYSHVELMDIEWAFETASKEGDWEFNGLMAVVDALMVIHECSTETAIEAKQRFVKQAANV